MSSPWHHIKLKKKKTIKERRIRSKKRRKREKTKEMGKGEGNQEILGAKKGRSDSIGNMNIRKFLYN